ncbi:MAG: helix-turn-helix domain-containing protein [Candidatus Aminicenantes bacterium]|nr:MAG: helix-turn-helix domain-containing protein [Candidatus Aminicenantes bacterium]
MKGNNRTIIWGEIFSFILICVFLIVIPIEIPASTIEVDDRGYMVTAWTIGDGLPQNSVLCLIQTREGYIWFGTQSGLVRFDGVRFRIYNRWNTKGLKNDRILALYQDTRGVLWVGTDGGGISGLKLKEGQWTLYTSKQGLSNNTVRAICGDSQNNLWFGTDNGLNYLDIEEGKIRTYTLDDGLSGYSVTALSFSGNGKLWVGTGGSGLNGFKDGKFLPVPLKETLYGKEITALHEDRSGALWIGTDYGLYCLKNSEIQSNEPVDSLSDRSIKAIMEDRRGGLWFGTDGEGLHRYQTETGIFTSINTRHGLPDDFIYSLLEDQESNLWIGTFTTGLVRLRPSLVDSITTADGLPENRVHTMVRDDLGYLWVGTQRKGLAKIKIEGHTSRVIQTFTSTEGLPGDGVRTLYPDREKNLWIGTTGGGLAKMKDGKFQVYNVNDGLSSNDITAVLQDQFNTLWVGTTNGLNQWKNGKFTLFHQQPGLANAFIRAIIEDQQGNLLVGTREGLYRLKDRNVQAFDFNYDVLALYGDRVGDLWIGTNGSGLIRFKQGDPAQRAIFTTDHGFPGNYIFSISEDSRGNLWMSSYRGVFRVSKKELNAFTDSKNQADSFITVVFFDEKEGMTSAECVMSGHPSAWRTSGQGVEEKLYIPTSKGIAVFAPGSITSAAKPPPPSVIIENVIADNQSIIDMPSPSPLPPDTQVVEFYFTAINLKAPDKVRILYKLDGFDTQWQEASPQQRRMAFYLNLPAGNYCFNVTACSSDGVWNHQGARFQFKINSHFYKRPVFYGLVLLVLAVITAVISWFLYKQKQVEAKKEEEKRKKEKYKTSALLPETVDQVLPQLTRLMEKEKAFLDPDLSLKKLSQQLHVHYNHLSRIINEHMGKTFNDYINSFRIEEAKAKLADPAEDQKTILEIAYDTGFYSKSVFNTAFKKFTGMTPSQFRRKIGR